MPPAIASGPSLNNTPIHQPPPQKPSAHFQRPLQNGATIIRLTRLARQLLRSRASGVTYRRGESGERERFASAISHRQTAGPAKTQNRRRPADREPPPVLFRRCAARRFPGSCLPRLTAAGSSYAETEPRPFPATRAAYPDAHATLITFCAVSGKASALHVAPPSCVPNT